MSVAGKHLYGLLPAHIRKRDAESGSPIEALFDVIGVQDDAIAADLARAYENLFIETSESWVIPYLAELVGTTPLYDASRCDDDATALSTYTDIRGPRLLPPVGASARADVARTISLRRRKGTISALYDVARYATGWSVHIVEGIKRDARTAHARHVRPDLQTAEVSNRLQSSLVGRPFDHTSRYVDLRASSGPVGWYHPRHVTVAVYRHGTQNYRRVAARPADQPWQFRLDPLAIDRALFTKETRVDELPTELASAAVPAEFQPALFEADLLTHATAPILPNGYRAAHTSLYGEVDEDPDASAASLGVWLDGVFVTPAQDESAPTAAYHAQVVSRRLDPWPATQPAGNVVAIDVRNGRLAIGSALAVPSQVRTSFFHGTAGTLGGGSYDRAPWMIAGSPDRVITVGTTGADFTDLGAALTTWSGEAAERTLVQILDSETYVMPSALTATARDLIVEAANGQRPVLQPGALDAVLQLTGTARFTFSGVAIDGRITLGNDVELLRLMHVTLPPDGQRKPDGSLLAAGPSITVAGPSTRLRVNIAFSVLGEIRIDDNMDQLQILDSLVLSEGGLAVSVTQGNGPDLCSERCTFLGDVTVRSVSATACMFADGIFASRTQEGCVRYSYVPPKLSRTPRRFACQPELAVREALEASVGLTPLELADLANRVAVHTRPQFVSELFGNASCAQLDPDTSPAITTGAPDGSEIGVYSHVKQAQRLENLRRRLDEYVPAGIQAGIAVII